MNTTLESNIAEVIAEVEASMPGEPLLGEVINPTSYARYLNDREAYWVLNDSVLAGFFSEEVERAVDEASARGDLLSDDLHSKACLRALTRTVEFYQSVIGTTDRPGRVMPPPRPTHPGAWADDTITLVKAYVSYLRQSGVVLKFSTYNDN